MKKILNQLYEYNTLDKAQAKNMLVGIANGDYNNAQIASFLTVYMMRGITIDELEGFREALLELCVKVDFSEYNTVDMCGTGGDGKDTFNISTLSSFVVAGAGIKVTKHGNYGVSSACGSSNVMEFLGYQFTNDVDVLRKQLEETNICFLHAPLFHPAMKNVAPIRRELGVKTFFNMLGPLVNPCHPKNQVVGVFNLEVARLYNYLLQKTEKNYVILHALDGYDEISLTGDVKMISNKEERIISPADLNLRKGTQEEIFGGSTVEEAANIFKTVISAEGTEAQNNVVIANSAMAIHCVNEVSLEDAVEQARESLLGKKALNVMQKLLQKELIL